MDLAPKRYLHAHKRDRARSMTGYDHGQELLMITPALILLFLFLLLPFLMSIELSFTNQRLVQGPVPTKFIGMRNYVRILSDPEFWQAFWNIMRFSLMVIPLQCGFALIMANFLNKLSMMKSFLRSLYFLPFITPMVIVTVIWQTIYQYPNGIMNTLVSFFSFGAVGPIEWLGSEFWAMPSIVLLSAWQAYGFQMIIYLGGLQNIPNEIYEAADIDGATGWEQFRFITWPSLINTNVLILIITTIQALKLFTQVNILTKGGPNGTTNTLVHYIYESGFVGQKIGYSAASSLLLFLLIFGIFLVQRLSLSSLERN
jgi:multiple sugar transport system permease protein